MSSDETGYDDYTLQEASEIIVSKLLRDEQKDIETIRRHDSHAFRKISDLELYYLWTTWSQDVYCAGFMIPNDNYVAEFIKWLLESSKEEP